MSRILLVRPPSGIKVKTVPIGLIYLASFFNREDHDVKILDMRLEPIEVDILTRRISFPSNYSPYVSPKGKSSVLAEITCNIGDEIWVGGE